MWQANKPIHYFTDIIITSVITLSYLLLSFLLIGFKKDQLFLAGLFNLLYYVSSGSRKLIIGFSIFILYWIIFDYMKAFPNYDFNTVDIQEIYNAEKYLFGISIDGRIVTANEYWLQHTNPILDTISGVFYLCWIPVPLLFAGYLFYSNREQFLHFAISFFSVNLLGFIIYYLYPAAPPWYMQQNGIQFIAHTAGNAAGLQRFDQLINIGLFQSLYAKSSNVFAAMPSLHASYPVIVLYFGIKNRLGKINILFALISIGIWFAAVYTSHHYVLDILGGILCALAGITIFKQSLTFNTRIGLFLSAILKKII